MDVLTEGYALPVSGGFYPQRGRDRGAPASTSESPANAPSAPLKTAPHAMTGPAADVPSTMTVAASCVREVTPSFR
jgi:hypothetical protein